MPRLTEFSPNFEPDVYTAEQIRLLQPFFTNLDQSVYSPLIFSPEIIGALCSRTSRAAADLRKIFLDEYITPFIEENSEYGRDLAAFIDFLHKHPIEKIFSNPRARSFYAKWLAQYGDDSIAQMAGMHLVYSSLSLVSIVFLESQRIGLAPIEKSTRYVDYGSKISGQYRYYADPSLKKHRLDRQYRAAMDQLFDTYISLLSPLQNYYQKQFPKEKPSVVEKKAFDTLRRILPSSTLSQVAFFGNGQAFEYLAARSLKHPLGEIRWAGERAYEELYKIAPSFLRRVKDPEGGSVASDYQKYLAGRSQRMAKFAPPYEGGVAQRAGVVLVEHDPNGENKIIAGMLYTAAGNTKSWSETLSAVETMNVHKKESVIAAYLKGRAQRWQKVGRAFENAYVRFELLLNIGAFRDIHRHRMLTEQYQLFTCAHGYDVPEDVMAAGFEQEYRFAISRAEEIYEKIAAKDVFLAQYATTLAHRVRFQQFKNLRECFWEMELRTIPEGHPDYRKIEQEKFKLIEKAYPLIAKFMRVNMGDYDFARRGQDEKIQAKLTEISRMNV